MVQLQTIISMILRPQNVVLGNQLKNRVPKIILEPYFFINEW